LGKRNLFEYLMAHYFKLRPSSLYKRLDEISLVEQDSAWQALRGFYQIQNKSIQLIYMNLYMEELSHAALFKKLASSKCPTTSSVGARIDAAKGLQSDQDLYSFLQFQLHGEAAAVQAHQTFLKHTKYFPEIHSAFKKVFEDEALHIARIESQMAQLESTSINKAVSLKETILKKFSFIKPFFQKINRLLLLSWLLIIYFIFGTMLIILMPAQNLINFIFFRKKIGLRK
jgi:hypothetical protein